MTIKRWYVLVLLVLAGNVYVSAQKDTARIHALVKYATTHREDSASSDDSLEVALKLAKAGDLVDEEANVLIARGSLYYIYGHFRKAREILYDAFNKANRARNYSLMGRSARIIGVTFDGESRLDSSQQRFLQALDYFILANDLSGQCEAYNSIAIVYNKRMNHEQALKHYQKALALAIKTGNKRVELAVYNNLGSVYNERKKLDSAMFYYDKALNYYNEVGDEYNASQCYHNLGTLYLENGNPSKALDFFRRSFRGRLNKDLNQEHVNIILSLGLAFKDLKQYDSAAFYFDLGLDLAQDYQSLMKMQESYLYKSELAYEIGAYKEAYDFLTLHTNMNDSLQNSLFDQKIMEAETRFRFEETERDLAEKITRLEDKKKNNFYLTIAIVVLFFLLIFSLMTMIRLNINKRKLNQSLEAIQRNSEIIDRRNMENEQLLQEKNELVGVIAHDLRSPFSKVQNITELLRVSNEVERIQYLGLLESISKDGMSLIQDLIDLSRIDSLKDKTKLLERAEEFTMKQAIATVVGSLQETSALKGIRMEVEEASDELLFTRRDFCERVLDNLLSNAIKFSPLGSEIRISARRENDREIAVCIKDSGPGFTEEDMGKLFEKFRRLSARPTGMEQSTGLGLFIAKMLTESIGGQLRLTSKAGESASFCVYVPVDLRLT